MDLLSLKGFIAQHEQAGECYPAAWLMAVISQSRDGRKKGNVTVPLKKKKSVVLLLVLGRLFVSH